jgi:3'(2'), 5'-bisphosphate nucleotidase
MSKMDPQTALPIAERAVAAACSLCRSVAAAPRAALTKDDRSPVTLADYGSQAVLSRLLGRAFPDIPVVGEETADALRDPDNRQLTEDILDAVRVILPEETAGGLLDQIDRGRHPGGARGVFWTIDPIDGTKGFLRGDQYAVALALIEDGEVRLGVLGCPNLPLRSLRPSGSQGCLFSAIRGRGAIMRTLDTMESFPIRVNQIDDPAHASFCESVESAHQAHGQSARVAQRLGVTVPPCRIDSQCKYGALARGDAAIYLRLPSAAGYQEKIWDHAAGAILVEEAGGTVTDAQGQALDFSRGRLLTRNRGIIATNGRIHRAVVRAVNEVAPL